MESAEQFTSLASLIGEPARAMMLWSLLDGKAYTAGELALTAGISPRSASNHLNKLIGGGLLCVERLGKHRYYCFARHEVAYTIDWTERRHHLAGALGAALLDQLIIRHWVRRKPNERTVLLTAKGEQALEQLGVSVSAIGNQ